MSTDDDLNKAARDLLEMLDLWEHRNKDAIRFAREHERQPFRQVCWISPIDGAYASLGLRPGAAMKAWSRDLTPGGMGFVTNHQIPAEEIVVCMKSVTGASIRVRAAVRRRKKVHQDFWEFGVQFQEKLTDEPAEESLQTANETASV